MDSRTSAQSLGSAKYRVTIDQGAIKTTHEVGVGPLELEKYAGKTTAEQPRRSLFRIPSRARDERIDPQQLHPPRHRALLPRIPEADPRNAVVVARHAR